MTCAFSSTRCFPLALIHRRPHSLGRTPSIHFADSAVLVPTPYPSAKPFRFHTCENQGEGGGSTRSRDPLSLSSSLFLAPNDFCEGCLWQLISLFLNGFRTFTPIHPGGRGDRKNTRGVPLFHPSVSATQSFLCFSGFRRLSGITFIPAGAGPTFRARRRASVPASSFFFFLRMMLSLASPFTFRPQNATILVP